MTRRQRLGQHFLDDVSYLRRIVEAARIGPEDRVLEAGTGFGALTQLLCTTGASVISYEIDPALYHEARERLAQVTNLDLRPGDAFDSNAPFTVFVSNLPFSASRRFLDWLAGREFHRAVVTLQREFADKLRASPGGEQYRAVSVVAQARFRLSEILQIPRDAFTPPPRVGATVLLMEPRRPPLSHSLVLALKHLFAYRGRKLSRALRDLLSADAAVPRVLRLKLDERVERLDPDMALTAARAIARSQRVR